MIPLLDVGKTYSTVRAEMDAAYSRVMNAGWFINGREVGAFEAEFAAYCGVSHAVGVGNGLDALAIVLEARGIGPGDEVLTSAHTFIATWLAIAKTGATVVPVDADIDTMNTTEDAFIAAITPRTRAVVPVHLYGQSVPMERLMRIADERGILVLEDAAQAHGAKVRGRRVGNLGHAAAFSFYPGKNLGAFGDGGAILTNDAALADACRRIANYGAIAKYDHAVRGVNTRLDELQAAFLRVKLRYLDGWNDRRKAIATQYLAGLSGVPGIELPTVPWGVDPVWHLFVIRTNQRARLQAMLTGREIGVGVHYPIPNHRSGAFSDAFAGASFPVAEQICETCLSLPIGPQLEEEDVVRVIEVVRQSAEELEEAVR